MKEPHEIGLEALKQMRKKEGAQATFPADKIWIYANDELGSLRRPAAITRLRNDGYITPTGKTTRAVTEARAGSPTTEYRFGPAFEGSRPGRGGPSPLISEMATEFHSCCEDILQVSQQGALRLCASLLAKRFVILTGLSGSGKTKLAQAFVHWIAPNRTDSGSEQDHYAIIPVGADWTGSDNILGYPDALDPKKYVTRPALELIRRAKDASGVPHFIILDEMNLSHVERYFADLLSATESGEEIPLYEGESRQINGIEVPQKLGLPPNLFVLGTVNVDETTYMFSPKVLDRANVIEFRVEREHIQDLIAEAKAVDLSKIDGLGAAFGEAFVQAASTPVEIPAATKDRFESETLLFFDLLREHNSEFGYRVVQEAARFIHFYKLLNNHPDGDVAWFPNAFDCVVFQKFLPKLHGSRTKLGPLLKKLWFLCVNDGAGRGSEPLKAVDEAAGSTDKKAEPSSDVPAGAPYPLSAEKIGRMWRLLRDNGFTSFAEA